jgi:large subunit ribosomal protein L24
MNKSKHKKITYTKSPIKPQEKRDRIVLNEAWLKGCNNPRRSWDIKLGDTVIVIKGDDKGKTGKVTKVLPQKAKVIVEGLNLVTKHAKAANQQEGEIKKISAPMWIWTVAHAVEVNGKTVATRIRKVDGKRVAVKTGKPID